MTTDSKSPAERDADALRILSGISRSRSDPETSEQDILRALRLSPGAFEVLLGAYRFYFYNHRFAQALPFAEALLARTARRLNIAADWRHVRAGDADFAAFDFAPGLFLQALIALGYCHLRLGDFAPGRACLEKAATLDASGRFGAQTLLAQLDAADTSDD